jgi:LDH2 family malate/lactate/ureidoglycolate dehydrogenase
LCWGRSTAPLAERLAWLPAVAVVVVLNAYLWSGATAFMRAATEAGLLSILVILGSGRRAMLTLAGVGLGALWTLTALGQLTRLG